MAEISHAKAELSSTLEQYQINLAEVQTLRLGLESQVAQGKSEIDDLTDRLANSAQAMEALESQYQDLDRTLTDT